MPNNPETIEQAREMLLENDNTIAELRAQLETANAQLTERDARIVELQEHNQRLFLRIPQGEEEPEPEPEPVPTLEEYALTLKGVF